MSDTRVQLACRCGTRSEHDITSVARGAFCPACGKRIAFDALDLLEVPIIEDISVSRPSTRMPARPGAIQYASALPAKKPQSARLLIACGNAITYAVLRLVTILAILDERAETALIIIEFILLGASLFLLAAGLMTLLRIAHAHILFRSFLVTEAVSILAPAVLLFSQTIGQFRNPAIGLLFMFGIALFRAAMAFYFWWSWK